MSEKNKALLLQGNDSIASANYEGFLSLCTDDTTWHFVGDTTLVGKEAVREWMKKTYTEPPVVTVTQLIAEGDFLTAIGTVTMKVDSKPTRYAYCDVWRFEGNKMAELHAFVIERKDRDNSSL